MATAELTVRCGGESRGTATGHAGRVVVAAAAGELMAEGMVGAGSTCAGMRGAVAGCRRALAAHLSEAAMAGHGGMGSGEEARPRVAGAGAVAVESEEAEGQGVAGDVKGGAAAAGRAARGDVSDEAEEVVEGVAAARGGAVVVLMLEVGLCLGEARCLAEEVMGEGPGVAGGQSVAVSSVLGKTIAGQAVVRTWDPRAGGAVCVATAGCLMAHRLGRGVEAHFV